jgi:chitin disaccharide deacetylase
VRSLDRNVSTGQDIPLGVDLDSVQVSGFLIVNADDFGGHRAATDRTVECFEAGRITSTTAMVHMGDSERAAELARSHELPVGLHLNLTQEFEDPRTPAAVRERHTRAVRYFAHPRRRRVTYNPILGSLVKECVADQLACFRELFGSEPTHIDGHNHAHLSPTVLFALPKGAPVRTGERQLTHRIAPKTLLASARHAMLARRQLTTDRFIAIDRLGASPDHGKIEQLLNTAERASVEVMVHPHREHDYDVLMSELWHAALQGCMRGSYAELAGAHA